jgi:hypothetical protein
MATILNSAPSGSGNDFSTLRQVLNSVTSRNGTLPSVVTRGCTLRTATYSTTGTRPFDVVQAIGSGYPFTTPWDGGTKNSVVASAGAVTQTITAKASTTFPAIPVYGAYIRINASNQVTMGGITLSVAWKNAQGESMDNSITVDPAFTDNGGVKSVELWVFPAAPVLGRYVYVPAAVTLGLATTPAYAAQTVVVSVAASILPDTSTVFTTLLTRGQREVDDVFSSYSATQQRLAQIGRSF